MKLSCKFSKTKEVEKIHVSAIKKFRVAPNPFFPFAITIILRVAKAFSIIFKINISKQVIISP